MQSQRFVVQLQGHRIFRLRHNEDRLYAIQGDEHYSVLAYRIHIIAKLTLKGTVLYIGHFTGQTSPVPPDQLIETDHICLLTAHRDYQDCLKSCILFPDDTTCESELPTVKNYL